MQNVIVTGGSGFIGHHLVNRLLELRKRVTIIDNLSGLGAGKESNDKSGGENTKVSFYKEDIRNGNSLAEIFKQEKPDCCIHLAAKISVSESVTNPSETLDVNVLGTLNVLEACSKAGVRNLVFASSAAAYGEPMTFPITEDHVLNPLSPYGASKAAAEVLVSSYRNLNKIPNAISLRFFNVYGKGQNMEYAGVITKFHEKLAQEKPIVIFGDGEQTRDFVSVNDVVKAIILAAETREKQILLSPATFNIATGTSTRINQLAQLMIKLSGQNSEIIYQAPVKGDIRFASVDMTRANQVLQFVPEESLEKGLENLVKSMNYELRSGPNP